MSYVYVAAQYVVTWVIAFFLWNFVENYFHIHRWGKWKRYVRDSKTYPQTRQYRICKRKECEKMEDESVSYGVIPEETDVKWNEIEKRYE